MAARPMAMPSARKWPCGRLLASSFLTAPRPRNSRISSLERPNSSSSRRAVTEPRVEAEQARARAQVMGDDDAVARCHTLEDRRFLKGAHDALARDGVRREARNDLAVERHFAARRLHERRDQLEDGRFSRAVGADDRQDLVRLDVERDVVDRHEAAVALGQVRDLRGSAPFVSSCAATRSRRLRSPFGSSRIMRIITPE